MKSRLFSAARELNGGPSRTDNGNDTLSSFFFPLLLPLSMRGVASLSPPRHLLSKRKCHLLQAKLLPSFLPFSPPPIKFQLAFLPFFSCCDGFKEEKIALESKSLNDHPSLPLPFPSPPSPSLEETWSFPFFFREAGERGEGPLRGEKPSPFPFRPIRLFSFPSRILKGRRFLPLGSGMASSPFKDVLFFPPVLSYQSEDSGPEEKPFLPSSFSGFVGPPGVKEYPPPPSLLPSPSALRTTLATQ